jgi:putative heme-binding domain-containing protein
LPDADLDLKAEVFRSLRGPAADDPHIYDVASHSVSERTGSAEAWSELDAQLAFLAPKDPNERQPSLVLPPPPSRPQDFADWKALLTGSSAADLTERGRRVFFHPNGPGCYKCHTVEGRGGRVGPDLSNIGRSTSREKLIESILEPSKEVAPQFTTWSLIGKDGVVHTGMIVHENEGKTILGDAEGKTVELPTLDVEERTPQRTSVMPEKMQERMTVQEFRDLLAFLKSLGV